MASKEMKELIGNKIFASISLLLLLVLSSALILANNKIYVNADDNKSSSDTKESRYNIADIDLSISVPDSFVVFTQNVTSNNSYLEKIGVDDVEQQRNLMKATNIFLEIVPKDDEITYEFIVKALPAPSGVANFNETNDNDLKSLFETYVKQSQEHSDSDLKESIDASSIEKINGIPYFTTQISSTSNNGVTVKAKKYYTVIRGYAYTYSLQTNETEIKSQYIQACNSMLESVEYKEIKNSIFNSSIYSELLTTILSLGLPIIILGLITYFLTSGNSKRKKRLAKARQEEALAKKKLD